MALSEAAARDVHVHTHPAGRADKPEKRAPEAPKTARAGATQARVIPLRPDLRQEPQAPEVRRAAGGVLDKEIQGALNAVRDAAQDSDWARGPITVVDAARKVFPAKGEAPGKIAWVAMSVSGAFGLLLVALGHLIAYAGQGRIRPAVVAAVAILASTLSYLAAHAA